MVLAHLAYRLTKDPSFFRALLEDAEKALNEAGFELSSVERWALKAHLMENNSCNEPTSMFSTTSKEAQWF
jgi:hypothetical protein